MESHPNDAEHTTVLTAEPLMGGLDRRIGTMGRTFSQFARRHGTQKLVPTDCNLTWEGLAHARDILHEYIMNTPGKKIVFGYSRGAQVAGEWLRTYAPTSPIPPRELRFVFIGNPQRRLGGVCERSEGKTLDGVRLEPTPDNTQYRVDDYSRRDDGWSNMDYWPEGNPSGRKIAYLLTIGRFTIHCNYKKQSEFNPENQVRATVGNTTYWVTP